MEAPGFELSRHHGLQTEGLLINYLFQRGPCFGDRRVCVLPLFDINDENINVSAHKCESLNGHLKKKIHIANYASAQYWVLH